MADLDISVNSEAGVTDVLAGLKYLILFAEPAAESVGVTDVLTMGLLVGVVTYKWKSYGQAGFALVIDWDCGASQFVVPDTEIPGYGQPGFVSHGEVNPGTQAPTDNYDVVLESREGADLFGTGLNNLDTINSEFKAPAVAGVFYDGGDLTFKLTNNAVHDAAGRVVVYFRRS